MLTDEFFLGTKLYHKKLAELCLPIANYLGTTHAIYVNVDKDGRLFSVCTHSKWVQRFLEEQYYNLDPFMVNPKNIHNGFSFDSASDEQEFKDVFLYDAAINFHLYHSFVYIEKIKGGGYYGFAFATNKENYKIMNRLMNESQIVKKLIRDLHYQLTLAIFKDLQEKKMDFAALKGDLFHNQKGLIFNEECKIKNKIQLLKEAGFLGKEDQDFLTKFPLSRQETNCLRIYLSAGNIKSVSKELELATTTVTSYIENIKNKLNCTSKNALFEKGEILESLGLI